MVQNSPKTALKYPRAFFKGYGVSSIVFSVSSLNSSIYSVPMIENTVLTIARETATGNQSLNPLRKQELATDVLLEFLRKGRHIVRAERRRNVEDIRVSFHRTGDKDFRMMF